MNQNIIQQCHFSAWVPHAEQYITNWKKKKKKGSKNEMLHQQMFQL